MVQTLELDLNVLLSRHAMTSVTALMQTVRLCCLEKYDTMTSLKPVDETRCNILLVVLVHLQSDVMVQLHSCG